MNYVIKHPISSLFRLVIALILLCQVPLAWWLLLRWWEHIASNVHVLLFEESLSVQADASLQILYYGGMMMVGCLFVLGFGLCLWLMTEPTMFEESTPRLYMPPPPVRPRPKAGSIIPYARQQDRERIE